MKDRITKRKDALFDFSPLPQSNWVDAVMVLGNQKDFSRVLNDVVPLPHIEAQMLPLYKAYITALEKIPEEKADNILETLQTIKIVDVKIIHNEVTMTLSAEVKKLLPKEAHAPLLALVNQATELSFDAIYTPNGSYQPDFSEFMEKSFNRAYCLRSMERYCETTGQSLERDLVSSAGLYITAVPAPLADSTHGVTMANFTSNNLMLNTFKAYTEARFDVIHKKAEKTALKKVCEDLEAHFSTQTDSPYTKDKLEVLGILKKQLEIKGFTGLKAFADYYQRPETMNTLRKGSDNLTLIVLKAVGETLASIFSLGVYAAVRAHQSQQQFGTKQFWLTPDQVIDKKVQKHAREVTNENEAPPTKKPRR